MDKEKEIIQLLKDTYNLEDLNKEDNKQIGELRRKINKYEGIMSLRSKQKNQIMNKIKEMVTELR